MLILINNEGRFAHQLSQFVHLILLAKENNTSFTYPSFQHKYLQFFQLDERVNFVPISFKYKAYCVLYPFLKLLRIKSLNFSNTTFQLNLKQKKSELLLDQSINKLIEYNKSAFVFDYLLKDINMIVRNRSYIKQILKFNPTFHKPVLDYLKPIKNQYKLLLGLHIRRTDYAHYEGGRFYLKDDIILALLASFYQQIGVAKNQIALLICSDEKIDKDKFKEYEMFYKERPFIDDFFILKECDYIIGPHSIFTLMANYLGDNKICQITDNSAHELKMTDFLRSEQLLKQEYMHIKSIEER